jgi:formylglycine-generating enzyme required for sulfatase activity
MALGYGSSEHEVCVNDFYIGKYEVSQGEWVKVMGDNPSHFLKCGEDCPVEQVSWDDTVTFTGRMRKNGGKSYRLPTEAEWEYACRSGGKNETYCGGANLDELAWYEDNSGNKTQPVGTKQPNGLGIYDMSGNVWEWCSDWFSLDYNGKSPKDNPKGPDKGQESFKVKDQEISGGPFRVLRGGSYGGAAAIVRSVTRTNEQPGDRIATAGFRLVFPPQ